MNRVILLTLFVSAVLGLVWFRHMATPPIYKTPESLIHAYLVALREKDSQAIARLTSPNHDIEQPINEKIQSYGGSVFGDLSYNYQPTENPYYMAVEIRGTKLAAGGATLPFEDRLNMAYDGRSWRLVLGMYHP